MKFPVLCILFSAFLSAFSQTSSAFSAEEVLEGFVFHKVKAGDTLSKIAPLEHWDIIKRVNRIDESHLVIGKKILIPNDLKKAKKFLPVPEYLKEAEKTKRVIYVFLEKQYFGAYEDGRLAFWGPISSGSQQKPSPRGSFKIILKQKKRVSIEVPGAKMPYSLQFSKQGHILHAQSLPGRPASHGCIRLLMQDAMKLFNWIRINDPVILIKAVPKPGTAFLNFLDGLFRIFLDTC